MCSCVWISEAEDLLFYLTGNRIIFRSEAIVYILLQPLEALWSSLCVALPAMEVVDIRQVSKQHISLVAKTCWQERSKRRIVHFSPVALKIQTNRVREIINKSTTSTPQLPALSSVPHSEKWRSSYQEHCQQLLHIDPLGLDQLLHHMSGVTHIHRVIRHISVSFKQTVSDSRLTVWADQCRLLHLYCTGESWPSDSHESPRSEPHRKHRMISFRNKHKVLI